MICSTGKLPILMLKERMNVKYPKKITIAELLGSGWNKYFVPCLLWIFQCFNWTDKFFTSLNLRTSSCA